MAKADLTSALSMEIDDMEGAQDDTHKNFTRVQQILQTMRAEGLPVPKDLAALEKTGRLLRNRGESGRGGKGFGSLKFKCNTASLSLVMCTKK